MFKLEIYTNILALEVTGLELELQRSQSPKLQRSLSPEIVSAISERRITRGKDVSSSYSSLIPKGRDNTTSTIPTNSEPVLEAATIRKPDTVLSFCIIIDN